MQNILLYIATVLIWGTTWIAIEFQLGTVDPLVSVCYRFFIAAFLMFTFCLLTGRMKQTFTVKEHVFCALLGFFLFCLNYCLVYIGTGYLPSGLVALCYATITVMNIVHQRLFFQITIDRRVFLSALMGLTGMIMVFYNDVEKVSLQDATFFGILLCLGSTYSASMGNMVSLRNTRHNMPILLTNAYGMLYGACISALVAAVLGKTFNFDTSWGYLISLSHLSILGTCVAFACYLTLIPRIGADKAAYTSVMIPIVALLISTFAEGYVWRPEAVAGVCLILIGNVLAMQKGNPIAHLRRKGWSLFKPKIES